MPISDRGMEILEAALQYAARGWPVLPLRPRGKEPLVTHGLQDATTDAETIRGWWAQWPDANVGVRTGRESGLVVIDVDELKGGDDSLRHLCNGRGIPDTPESLTGAGRHIWLKHPTDKIIRNRVELADSPGLDVRADGGYVVAPPSVHPNGKVYLWEASSDPQTVPLAELPDWLLALLLDHREIAPVAVAGEEVGEHRRNIHLTQVAGSLRARGSSKETILTALLSENTERCRPPLSNEEVRRIADSVAGYEPHSELILGRYTEGGLADRFLLLFGREMRYVPLWSRFFLWDTRRWAEDHRNAVLQLGRQLVLEMYEAGKRIPDEKQRYVFMAFTAGADRRAKLADVILMAACTPGIALIPGELDQNPWLLSVQNGTVDLTTGNLRECRREELITKVAGAAYDADARCPRWEQFIREVTESDDHMQVLLQQAVGYSLTGDTSEQVIFILWGEGANGKSTFLEVIATLLGDYATKTPTETLLVKRFDAIPNDVARLRGTRFVYAVEAEANRKLAESLIKQMSGGERLTARFLRAEFFEFMPECKLFLCTNHKPQIVGTDHAIWRRIRFIPFTMKLEPDKQDLHLKDKLLRELPGILNWALEGCRDWRKNGLSMPERVAKATAEYRAEMDVLAGFLEEELEQDPAAEIPAKRLYDLYTLWAEHAGEKVLSQHALAYRLKERGFYLQKHPDCNYWQGIRERPGRTL